MQDILHGRCSRMEQKILLAQHRMVRNFLRWHCFSQRTAGETAKDIQLQQGSEGVAAHLHPQGRKRRGWQSHVGCLKSSDPFYHGCGFFDPSYHLPHFYELFALWQKKRTGHFKEAAEASRNYLKRACHPVTGLSAEYAEFDGTPYQPVLDQWGGRHDWYYSDAYRTIANIALDYEWFAKDEWESENVDRFLNFSVIPCRRKTGTVFS